MAEHHVSGLARLRDQTGITVSELLRKMLDNFLCEPKLNQIIPACSGQMNTNLQR